LSGPSMFLADFSNVGDGIFRHPHVMVLRHARLL
jgi:hypothetical protein